MKGISLKGDKGALAMSSLHKYRNPVIYYCTVLQYGNVESYSNVLDLQKAMGILAKNVETLDGVYDDDDNSQFLLHLINRHLNEKLLGFSQILS